MSEEKKESEVKETPTEDSASEEKKQETAEEITTTDTSEIVVVNAEADPTSKADAAAQAAAEAQAAAQAALAKAEELKALAEKAAEAEYKAIAEEVKAAVGPLIVLGDFNTTDQTENYRLVANQLTDVHHTVGRGFGFTFPTGLKRIAGWFVFGPLVRIDLVFVSQHFLPQEIYVVPNSCGSDHRPVVASLQWANSAKD